MNKTASFSGCLLFALSTLCYNERQRKERKYFKKQAAAGAAVLTSIKTK